MFPSLAVLSLVLPLALIAAGVIALVERGNRRRRALLMWRAAQVSASRWYPVAPDQWLLRVAHHLFPGQPGRLGETCGGQWNGRGMRVFDYNYVVSNGKSQSTLTGNLVVLTLPVALPQLTVRRESGVLRTLRHHGLELENQQFNERFRVDCFDDRYGSAVMHPRMMECVLCNPGLQWHIAGNAFVTWSTGSFVVPDVFARLQAMTQLIDLIPPFVLRDYGRPVS
ncbi:hypothetical protein ACFV9C_13990 [Kribbella sp. NPDC059898]|uniref:hypothetical protein n=1 Tax=Kribbella sp. NPDC059898 TaxID=3346995 RepID=UPI003647EC4C